MKLEDVNGDKKAKRIAFQVESHLEKEVSLCDEDGDLTKSLALLSKSFNKVIKRLNRSNRSGPRSRNTTSVSTSVQIARSNTSTNVGSFDAGSRNKFNVGNSLEHNVSNKGI